MAAPVAGFIQLPNDTANTGKKIRTETKAVSGSTVHEHFYVPTIGHTIIGHYFFCSPQQSVSATVQNATTTGFFWFQNPSNSTVTMVLRSIIAEATAGSALATPTAPMISFTKGNYTGTATGAAIAPLSCATGGAVSQVSIRTAMTGMVPVTESDVGQFSIPSSLTAIGTFYGTKVVYAKNPLAWIRGLDLEFKPGALLVVWQSIAGTTSDTRKFTIQVEWDEVDLS